MAEKKRLFAPLPQPLAVGIGVGLGASANDPIAGMIVGGSIMALCAASHDHPILGAALGGLLTSYVVRRLNHVA